MESSRLMCTVYSNEGEFQIECDSRNVLLLPGTGPAETEIICEGRANKSSVWLDWSGLRETIYVEKERTHRHERAQHDNSGS